MSTHSRRKDLELEDGTTKIFLNTTSKNGSQELISLLQYMKNTDINNPEITVRDERLLELDKIVAKVKQSEEWEAVSMDLFPRKRRKITLWQKPQICWKQNFLSYNRYMMLLKIIMPRHSGKISWH